MRSRLSNMDRRNAPARNAGKALDLLSRNDIERIYGVTASQLRYLQRKGDGPPLFQLGPHTVRYDRSSFERWLCLKEVQ